jgi:hypothetical protein
VQQEVDGMGSYTACQIRLGLCMAVFCPCLCLCGVCLVPQWRRRNYDGLERALQACL